jgi:DNA-binding response OmpR family regulator
MLSNPKKQLSVPSIHLLIGSADMQATQSIYSFLEPSGYQLDSAATSEEVQNRLNTAQYDALVLDANFCDDNGIPLYTSLRLGQHTMPIILLVSESDTENLPRYINGGADDIVPIPLHLVELEARILARIRLAKAHRIAPKLTWAGIEIDQRAHTITCDGEPLHLPPLAFTLISCLMKAAPNVVTRSELEDTLYGDTPPSSDALRTYIHMLRSKLDAHGKPILKTVPRVGFRLQSLEEAQNGK